MKDAKKDINVRKLGKDSKTGLDNAGGLQISFKREIEKAKENKNYSGLGVLFFDIDNFKSFNDYFGQMSGDDLIKMIADRVKEVVRSADIVCRQGGEEFVVIITDIMEERLKLVAEKVHQATRFVFSSKKGHRDITTSMGAVYATKEEITQNGRAGFLEEILRQANEAEYHSKVTGKDRISYFKELPQKKEGILSLEDFEIEYYTKNNLRRRLNDQKAEVDGALPGIVQNTLKENFAQMEESVRHEVRREYKGYLCRLYQEYYKKPESGERTAKLKEVENKLVSVR